MHPTRAQYALDLLIRNLFERTAAAGFLAADLDLCRVLACLAAGAAPERGGAAAARPDWRSTMGRCRRT